MTGVRVLGVGESLIELRGVGRDQLSWTFAGDILNCSAAVAAANPIVRVEHMTGLGIDERSSGFLEFCRRLGVDARPSIAVSGKTLGLYWIATDDGERRFEYWRDDSASRHLLRSPDFAFPQWAPDVLLLSAITLAVAGPRASRLLDLVEALGAGGTTIMFDTNYRSALWADPADASAKAVRALSLAHTVHASADDVASLFAHSLAPVSEWCEQYGIAELLVTDGDGDVRAFSAQREELLRATSVDVVDTSGAGDAFFGTYIGHRLAGRSVPEAVMMAIEIASTVVQRPGALSYLTDPE